MKVSVLIRHVSVVIIYKLTWGFRGKEKKGWEGRELEEVRCAL